MVSANIHYHIAKEKGIKVYCLSEGRNTWVLTLDADSADITAFMTREELRDLYNAIGHTIGFSLPTTLELVEITQGV